MIYCKGCSWSGYSYELEDGSYCPICGWFFYDDFYEYHNIDIHKL